MDTIPKLLLRNAQQFAHRPAIREKEYGIWQTYTWADACRNVKAMALGLAALGFRRGDKLAIIGDNRPHLYWGFVAAQALGGVPVPLYQDSIAREVQYVIHHSEARFVLAEDQEQVDKILSVREEVPYVERVIYDDPKGMRAYRDPWLLSLVEVMEKGREFERAHPGYFEEQVGQTRPDDLALISYTSGTTGFPKGVMLTHYNLLANAANLLKVDRYRPQDEVVAYLPMAWIGDTFWSLAMSYLLGSPINIPEEPRTVQRDLREIGPHVFLAPPRIWENLLASLQVRIEDADPVKRSIYRLCMRVAREVEARRSQGKGVPPWLRLLYQIGDFLVYGPIRDHLGLRRVRYAYTGGAALGAEVLAFFRSLGVNLKQLYGLTESSAPATMQRDGEVRADTVGRPLPGVEVRISEEGEVLIKGPGVFQGYYKNPEATAAALVDGWLRTGDAGFLTPDGQLVIVDRLRDVARLADGTSFAPQWIENKLKFSPYIKEAVALGPGRPFVAALINIDGQVVGKWAEKHGVPYTSYMDLSQKPQVGQLICREVERVNRDLPPETRICRFLILHKELDPDDEEITRTRKVRRRFVAQKYAPLIEALYSDATRVEVTTTITYEDGRRAEVRSTVPIFDVRETARTPAGARREG
jgi:long-chain acyl-CoA synthetase